MIVTSPPVLDVGSVIDLPTYCLQQPCLGTKTTIEALSSSGISFFSSSILAQNVVSLINLVIQLFCVCFIWKNGYLKLSTFFIILFIHSSIISLRVFVYIISSLASAFIIDSRTLSGFYFIQPSLYLDYSSNFFSVAITFLMSLNRCLSFGAKPLNSRIFDGANVVAPVLLALSSSISCAVICIRSSSIERHFLPTTGFINIETKLNWVSLFINRMFFIFPLASIACYIVLFYVLRSQNKQAFTKSKSRNQGEQKVFVQLLITAILYGVTQIFYEAIAFFLITETSLKLFLISIFNVLNYLPEISLPLSVIASKIRLGEKRIARVAPKLTLEMNSVKAVTTGDKI
ncbi:Serpentine receptor class gamma [Caenorhabditis elegans]|uniref:Serpentine receptor class gamma n=1 Tax=Caenorhabditis elegans TaxID=6239 RepID=Q9XW59_CAEEL|nr:Serpentine receptor class gamma [Caenorhabditis elegans]CAA22112.1 Serpentine receptor class gamma [Caenorhabditis elegans]|eukprot:NP_499606.1 Uncharacterized protein CELE_Y75B8A.34 [Caenorhabditis elegans]